MKSSLCSVPTLFLFLWISSLKCSWQDTTHCFSKFAPYISLMSQKLVLFSSTIIVDGLNNWSCFWLWREIAWPSRCQNWAMMFVFSFLASIVASLRIFFIPWWKQRGQEWQIPDIWNVAHQNNAVSCLRMLLPSLFWWNNMHISRAVLLVLKM